ncbi:MAG: hypothetical protein JNM75_15305 [Rhodospirillales bacterium]|nr:hypothetical protein [Rhodospirillales bacterium]
MAAQRARSARAAGALQPIPTERRFIADGGIRFIVHVMASLELKEIELARRASLEHRGGIPANPFLPYDKALFVADLSATHLCLLNKYSVIDRHILIVTRAYEDQETPLTPADLAALALCLNETDGLGFFNGGTTAGASQPHKHLQFVPLPLAAQGPRLPVEPLIAAALQAPPGEPRSAGGLPFRHALCRLETFAAPELLQAYRTLLAAAGLIRGADEPADGVALPPYNLLVTRTWMLLIPRVRERIEGISVNALGFAGSLFVRDEAEMATLMRVGPMHMLEAAARPA